MMSRLITIKLFLAISFLFIRLDSGHCFGFPRTYELIHASQNIQATYPSKFTPGEGLLSTLLTNAQSGLALIGNGLEDEVPSELEKNILTKIFTDNRKDANVMTHAIRMALSRHKSVVRQLDEVGKDYKAEVRSSGKSLTELYSKEIKRWKRLQKEIKIIHDTLTFDLNLVPLYYDIADKDSLLFSGYVRGLTVLKFIERLKTVLEDTSKYIQLVDGMLEACKRDSECRNAM